MRHNWLNHVHCTRLYTFENIRENDRKDLVWRQIKTVLCAPTFANNWQLPFSNQWKEDYDDRNEFMINFANNRQMPFLKQWKGDYDGRNEFMINFNCLSWNSERGIMTIEMNSCSISTALLEQWKGDYDGRNEFMINFAKKNCQLPFLNQWKGDYDVDIMSWSISPITENCPSWISERGLWL